MLIVGEFIFVISIYDIAYVNRRFCGIGNIARAVNSVSGDILNIREAIVSVSFCGIQSLMPFMIIYQITFEIARRYECERK